MSIEGGMSMTTSMDRPLLRRTVSVAREDGHVVLRRLRDEVRLDGAAAELFSKAEFQLDGKTGIDAMAAMLSEPPARLRSLFGELERVGVLAFLAGKDDGALMTGEEFYAVHREHCTHWLES